MRCFAILFLITLFLTVFFFVNSMGCCHERDASDNRPYTVL